MKVYTRDKKALAFVLMLLLSHAVSADNQFPNTLSLGKDQSSPVAKLADISWLQGHWRGEAFGGIVEELWSPPLGDSMMGAFKLVVGDKVKFYELETIREHNQSLMLSLKHFNGDMTGWEEKAETVDFPLVKMTSERAYFSGFTIEKISANEINMYVVIDGKQGKSEYKFNYHRVKQ